MKNKVKVPKGFQVVKRNWNILTNESIDTGYAVRCKTCWNDCTQYHPTKRGALKELKQRGHSPHMCHWFRNTND